MDYSVKIRVNPQQTGIDTNVKHSMVRHAYKRFLLQSSSEKKKSFQNPFDEIGATRLLLSHEQLNCHFFFFFFFFFSAVEEAVRLREKHKEAVKSIQAVTIGPSKSLETLRTALALGADSAIHVQIPESSPAPEPLAVATALRAIIAKNGEGERPDLVILGKQSIDDDLGVTGQMLAGLLGWGQATFASKLEVNEAAKEVVVTREVDGGAEQVRCKLPLVVTTDLR